MPWRQRTEASPPHTPRQNALKRAGSRTSGWGRRLVNLVPGSPAGKVSRIPRVLRHPTSGVQRKDPSGQRSGQGVSRRVEAKKGREGREAKQLAGPRSPWMGRVPALSSPSVLLPGSRSLCAPAGYTSLRLSEEPHPDLCGPDLWELSAQRQFFANSSLSAKASLGLPAGELNRGFSPHTLIMEGRKEGRKKKKFKNRRKSDPQNPEVLEN